MRITSITPHPASISFKVPRTTAHEPMRHAAAVIVEVQTDAGISGVGQIHGAPLKEICDWVVKLGEVARGMDALHGCVTLLCKTRTHKRGSTAASLCALDALQCVFHALLMPKQRNPAQNAYSTSACIAGSCVCAARCNAHAPNLRQLQFSYVFCASRFAAISLISINMRVLVISVDTVNLRLYTITI